MTIDIEHVNDYPLIRFEIRLERKFPIRRSLGSNESCVTWATSVPILVFLGLSVLDLGPLYATDRQTSDSGRNLRAKLYTVIDSLSTNHDAYLKTLYSMFQLICCCEIINTRHRRELFTSKTLVVRIRELTSSDYMDVHCVT